MDRGSEFGDDDTTRRGPPAYSPKSPCQCKCENKIACGHVCCLYTAGYKISKADDDLGNARKDLTSEFGVPATAVTARSAVYEKMKIKQISEMKGLSKPRVLIGYLMEIGNLHRGGDYTMCLEVSMLRTDTPVIQELAKTLLQSLNGSCCTKKRWISFVSGAVKRKTNDITTLLEDMAVIPPLRKAMDPEEWLSRFERDWRYACILAKYLKLDVSFLQYKVTYTQLLQKIPEDWKNKAKLHFSGRSGDDARSKECLMEFLNELKAGHSTEPTDKVFQMDSSPGKRRRIDGRDGDSRGRSSANGNEELCRKCTRSEGVDVYHLSRADCPDYPGCFDCGGRHLQRDCPQGAKDARSWNHRPNQRHSDGGQQRQRRPQGRQGPRGGCFDCGGDHYKSDCPVGRGSQQQPPAQERQQPAQSANHSSQSAPSGQPASSSMPPPHPRAGDRGMLRIQPSSFRNGTAPNSGEHPDRTRLRNGNNLN